MNQNKIIISVPKNGSSENFEKRNLNQFIFGEIGVGPKVYGSTKDGIYVADKSPFPSVARSGGDVRAKMEKVDSKVDSMGIMYDNTKLDNVTHDTQSEAFQIIDAGGSSVPNSLTSKYKGQFAQKKKDITKTEVNNFIKTHKLPFSKLGSGEMRDVYEIDRKILELF